MPISQPLRVAAASSSPFRETIARTSAERASPSLRRETRTIVRRRTTINSATISSEDRRDIEIALAGLSLSRRHGQQQNNDETEVGYAITSGANPKRRSRSADALRDMASDHRMSPIQWRRRSDEIKHWRQSLNTTHLPPFSAGPPREADNVVDKVADTVPQHEVRVSQLRLTQAQSHADPDASFDFGPLLKSVQDATLAQRIASVELKVMNLEQAMVRMQQEPRFSPSQSLPFNRRLSAQTSEESINTVPLQRPPEEGRLHKSCHPEQTGLQRSMTSIQDPHFSQSPSSHSRHPSEVDIGVFAADRPTSVATTLRPRTAVREDFPPPRMSNDEPAAWLTTHHYARLMAMIRNEQEERENLKQQVAHLQRMVSHLQACQFSPADSYPTPSPESRYMHFHQPKSSFSANSSRNDLSEDTDAEDRFLDVYETPAQSPAMI